MPPLRSGTGSSPSKRSSVRAAPCATGCPARVAAESQLRPRRPAPCMAPRLGRPCSGRPAATSWHRGPCSLSRAFASPHTPQGSPLMTAAATCVGAGRHLLARARGARGGCAPVTPLAASHVRPVALAPGHGGPRSATLRGSTAPLRSRHRSHRAATSDGAPVDRSLPSTSPPGTASRALQLRSRSIAPPFAPSPVA